MDYHPPEYRVRAYRGGHPTSQTNDPEQPDHDEAESKNLAGQEDFLIHDQLPLFDMQAAGATHPSAKSTAMSRQ